MVSILDPVIKAGQAAQAQRSNRLMDAVRQQQLQQLQAQAPIQRQQDELSLRKQRLGIDESQLRQISAKAGLINRSAESLKRLPFGQRSAAYDQLRNRLVSAGVDVSGFDGKPLSDESLDSVIASTRGFIDDPAGAVAAVQEFEYITQGFSPEELEQARRVAAGIAPRVAGSAAITTATTPGLTEKVAGSEAAIAGAKEEAVLGARGALLPGIEAEVARRVEAVKRDSERVAAFQKKADDAQSADEVIELAEPLLDVATESLAGAFIDATGALFGLSNEGAEAAAQLKILGGKLVANVPRFEGPQSDKDTQLYREMAGQIGDPTVPAEVRRAALTVIKRLNKKAKEQQAGKEAELGVQQETEASQEQTIKGFTRQQYIDAGATAEELRELGF